jgi:GGDEF domain-containing protein
MADAAKELDEILSGYTPKATPEQELDTLLAGYGAKAEAQKKEVSTLGTYGETIGQALKGVPAAAAQIYEGATPYSEVNLADTLQENQEKKQREFEAEPGGNQEVLGGFATAEEVKKQAPSMSTAVTSLVPAVAAGALGGLLSPIPGGTLIGAGLGGVGSYYATKRAEENQFVKQYVESENAKRQANNLPPLTQDEKIAFQNKIIESRDVNKMGHAGAAPEIAGTALEAAIAATPVGKLAKFLPKGAVTRGITTGLGKLGAIGATEVGTEGITRNLQQPILVRTGMEEGQERDPLSLSDLATSTGEVAKPTLLGVLPMAGLGGGVGAYQGYKHAKNENASTEKEFTPEEQALKEAEDQKQIEPENLTDEPDDVENYVNESAFAMEVPPSGFQSSEILQPETESVHPVDSKTQAFVDSYQATLDSGGIPSSVSNSLRHHAQQAGVYDSKDTPLEMFDKLKGALYTPTPEESADTAREIKKADIAATIPENPGVLGKTVLSGLDVLEPVIEAGNKALEASLMGLNESQLTNLFRQKAATPDQKKAITEERNRRKALTEPNTVLPIQENENAIEKPETSPLNGGSGTQSELLSEGGDTAINSEGISSSGFENRNIEQTPQEVPPQQPEITNNDETGVGNTVGMGVGDHTVNPISGTRILATPSATRANVVADRLVKPDESTEPSVREPSISQHTTSLSAISPQQPEITNGESENPTPQAGSPEEGQTVKKPTKAQMSDYNSLAERLSNYQPVSVAAYKDNISTIIKERKKDLAEDRKSFKSSGMGAVGWREKSRWLTKTNAIKSLQKDFINAEAELAKREANYLEDVAYLDTLPGNPKNYVDQAVEKPIDEVIAKEHPLHDDNAYQEAAKPEDNKKAFVNFQDLPIAIENPKGSQRKGKDPSGKEWSTTMQDHYGEIKLGEGADGDAVDVFIPEGLTRGQIDSTDKAFIVDQIDPQTGKFDEHKVMLGYPTKESAKEAYFRNYAENWQGLGKITEMPVDKFKSWLKDSNARKLPAGTGVQQNVPSIEDTASQNATESSQQASLKAEPTSPPGRRTAYTHRENTLVTNAHRLANRRAADRRETRDLKTELKTNHVTGIPNKKAFLEKPVSPFIASVDVDSLKYVNDNLGEGHVSGDKLLRAVAQVLSKHVDAYHVSGDEILVRGDDALALKQELEAANAELSSGEHTIISPTGSFSKPSFSYGIAETNPSVSQNKSEVLEEALIRADQAMVEHKTVREASGERAGRGERPNGFTGGVQEQVLKPNFETFATQQEAVKHLADVFGEGIYRLTRNKIVRITNGKLDWPKEGQLSAAEAVYDPRTGVIWVDINVTPRDRLTPVMIHELGEHFNLERILGAKDYAALQEQIKHRAKIKGSAAERVWNDVAFAPEYANLTPGSKGFIAEVIAKLGENPPPWYKRLLSRLKSFFITKGLGRGFILGTLTEDNLHHLLLASARAAARSDESGIRSNTGEIAYSRRIHGDEKSKEDFIVPETSSFKGNMSGVLAYSPEEAVASGIERLPIKLRIGEAPAPHKGFGISHIHDTNLREKSRNVPKYTGDTAENYARHVTRIANTFDQVLTDRGHLVFRSSSMKEALIVSKQQDPSTGEKIYSVVSIVPAETYAKWGSPNWSRSRQHPAGSPSSVAPIRPPTKTRRPSGRASQEYQSSPFNIADLDTPRQVLFSVPITEPAPRFYSALQKAIEKAPDKVFGNAQQIKVWLVANAPKFDVKKDEVYWSGITDWLDTQTGKVSKADVTSFLRENGVRTHDVLLSEQPNEGYKQYLQPLNAELKDMAYLGFDDSQQARKAIIMDADWAARWDVGDNPELIELGNKYRAAIHTARKEITKHHDSANLTVPGGSEYHELVVTVPTTEAFNQEDKIHFGDTAEGKHIGWVRYNTRTDSDGNKVLFLEEIQSQRGQEGRKHGFKDDSPFVTQQQLTDKKTEINRRYDQGEITPEQRLLELEYLEQPVKSLVGVPPAPFVTDSNNKATNAYISLLLKKAVSAAIDGGHSMVAWTTGDQQADRYSLDKTIAKLIAQKTNSEGVRTIDAFFDRGESVHFSVDKDGKILHATGDMSLKGKSLSEVLGKSIADGILQNPDSHVIDKKGLKAKAVWTQAMYGDENGLTGQGKPALITQAANDLVRKMGGEVRGVSVNHGTQFDADYKEIPIIETQPALIITPEMRDKIVGEGMPMFSVPTTSTREFEDSSNPLADTKDEILSKLARQKLGLLSVRQIVEVSKKYLPGLKAYTDHMQARRAKVDPFLHRATRITDKWKTLELKSREAVGRIMQQSTLADTDLSIDWLGVQKNARGEYWAYSQTAFNGLSIDAIKQAAEGVGALSLDKHSATFATEAEARSFLKELQAIDIKQTQRREKNAWKDPNIARRASYAKLKPEFNALPKEGKKIYSDTYALHTDIFSQRLNALEERVRESILDGQIAKGLIAQLRLKFESQSLSWYYAPLKRYGDHWFYGKDAKGEPWFLTYESDKARDRGIKNFTLAGGEEINRGTTLKDLQGAQTGDLASDNFVKSVQDKISLASLPVDASKALQDEIYQLYLSTLPDVSVRHGSMHRKGTKGQDKDAMRAFANTIHHGASQLANMTEGRKMNEALKDAETALKISSNKSKRNQTRFDMEAARLLEADWEKLKLDGVLEDKRESDPELYDAAIKLRNMFGHLDMSKKIPAALKVAEQALIDATTSRDKLEASRNLQVLKRISEDWAKDKTEDSVDEKIKEGLDTGTPNEQQLYKAVAARWHELQEAGDPEEAFVNLANKNEKLLNAADLITNDNRHKAANVIAELKGAYDAMVNTNSTDMDKIAAAIRQFDFVMTMGFGLSSGLLNLFQTPVVAMPIAVGKYGINATRKAFGNTRNEFIKAISKAYSKDSSGNYIYRDEDDNTSISQIIMEKIARAKAQGASTNTLIALHDRLSALNTFKEEGDVSRTNFFDIIGIGKEGEDYGGKLQDFNKSMGWMFHHGERMNREISLMAAYDLARSEKTTEHPNGMDHQEAIDYARWLNNTAHGDYNSENAARIFRGPVAGVVMQYKKYPQAMFYLWATQAKGAATKWRKLPDKTPEQAAVKAAAKEEARQGARSLSALFLMQGLAAGAFGLPLMGIVTAVLNTIGTWVSDDDEPWDVERETRVAATQIGGETFATALTKGIGNAFTSGNFSPRMSLANVFFQEPLKDKEGRDEVTEYLSQVAGPFGGMLKKILGDGAGYLAEGDVLRAAESAAPKAVGDVLKAARIAHDDYRSRNEDFLKDASAMEILFQLAGISSSNMETLYTERGYIKEAESSLQDARQKLVNKLARAALEGKELPTELLARWNEKHPTWPIGRDNIVRSMKGISSSAANRGDRGYSVNPKVEYLYDKYRERDEEDED